MNVPSGDLDVRGARSTPVWLDVPDRPAARPPLDADLAVDLLVVGGGFTGLWAALLALEAEPSRSVAVVEAARLGWAASGRNGGFCAASLTHGLGNGLSRWPEEIGTLLRLGHENLGAIEEAVAAHGLDCGFERTGELDVAVAPWQVSGLRSLHAEGVAHGEDLEWLDRGEVRSLVDSPTYLAGVLDRRGVAMLDPARLVWGLAAAVERLGGTVHEGTRVTGLSDDGDRVTVRTTGGTVRARQVVLGSGVFRSPLRRARAWTVPVWDHVIATAPLPGDVRACLGWAGRQGIGDAGNQFHYYRLTRDDRLVFGGYDALYYFGGDLSLARARRGETEQLLREHLVTTFPQLADVEVTHAWGGAIDTSTRFCATWDRAMGGKVAAVAGYTGLGVGASRFGAQVCLDLLSDRPSEAASERLGLRMVRRPPVPWPPEPVRWAGIELTRRAIARADAREGRRGAWLRTLDALGLGFDS